MEKLGEFGVVDHPHCIYHYCYWLAALLMLYENLFMRTPLFQHLHSYRTSIVIGPSLSQLLLSFWTTNLQDLYWHRKSTVAGLSVSETHHCLRTSSVEGPLMLLDFHSGLPLLQDLQSRRTSTVQVCPLSCTYTVSGHPLL